MHLPVIDLHDYLELSLLDRLVLLQNNGVIVGTVSTKIHRHELFMLGSFYVEVRTMLKRDGENINDAIPFVKGPRLDKYLDCINLSFLMNA